LALAAVKPSYVRNRCYARTGWDREVREVCRDHGIVYQGFSLLTANREELGSKAMKQLAARTGRSPTELVFRFAVAVGMLPLTGTSSADHMRLDLGALDFPIDGTELELMGTIAEAY
jgi:diketogulonate reductase-like aldo/keto reductase